MGGEGFARHRHGAFADDERSAHRITRHLDALIPSGTASSLRKPFARSALDQPVDELVVSVLNRPRHAKLIEEIREAGAGTPVVFIHGWTLSSEIWSAQVDWFAARGLRALAYDRRGHGQSTGSAGDLPAMTQDVRAALQWLITRPNVRSDAMAVVGASLGATLSLLASVDVPQVRAIGLLSPSLDYRGLRTDVGLVKRLGARSLWMASSAEDPLANYTRTAELVGEPDHLGDLRADGLCHLLIDRRSDFLIEAQHHDGLRRVGQHAHLHVLNVHASFTEDLSNDTDDARAVGIRVERVVRSDLLVNFCAVDFC